MEKLEEIEIYYVILHIFPSEHVDLGPGTTKEPQNNLKTRKTDRQNLSDDYDLTGGQRNTLRITPEESQQNRCDVQNIQFL